MNNFEQQRARLETYEQIICDHRGEEAVEAEEMELYDLFEARARMTA